MQGITRTAQNPLYYYVVAIPASSVEECQGNALCDHDGDRPIQRLVAAGATAPGLYSGDCAQGWVSADALDAFRNGM
ncbi:hypothetical protein [Xanthomonas theicola]|uniref:hypothetical protein n=1 Tax=Xanthomonas theicola TaxID=56464 RepID=UPI001FE6A182|nr:hypothetical protein [Xanthomonas theicola]